MTGCVKDYVNIFVDNAILTRTLRYFPSNKPKITIDVKDLLSKKNKTKNFEEEEDRELGSIQKQLKSKVIKKKGGVQEKETLSRTI